MNTHLILLNVLDRKNKMEIIKGDLIDLINKNHFDIIVHGCNCFCTMGSGFAKLIKENFHEAYLEDLKTIKGDMGKLGNYSKIECIRNNRIKPIIIVNAYTQYRYGRNKMHTDYNAILSVFKRISNDFNKNMEIAYPKIGAGLGGGDWNIISNIIDNELKDHKHYLVELQKL